MKNILKIVFVIIATLIGAGFASGKEIYSFFFIYGIKGILGIFISSFLISLVSYKVLKICYNNNIESYQAFCDYIIIQKFPNQDSKFVEKISKFINNMINILLLITFYIMISGFSSFLHQEFCINRVIGSIIIAILCFIAFQKNINGLIKISNYLVPILMFFLLYISAKNVDFINNYNNIKNLFINNSVFFPIIKAILYGSYNCILLIPVLVTLKKLLIKFNNIFFISISVFFAVSILSISVYNILLLGNWKIFILEMPIIQIIKMYGNVLKLIYLFLIGSSIYTTALSAGCAFLNGCKKINYKRNVALVCMTAIFFSQISFSVFVNLLYPVLGIIGLFEVIAILK